MAKQSAGGRLEIGPSKRIEFLADGARIFREAFAFCGQIRDATATVHCGFISVYVRGTCYRARL